MGHLREAKLIFPGKNLRVVFDKSVVAVRHRVGRVQVHEIALVGTGESLLEILIPDDSPLQKVACLPDSLLVAWVQMYFVAVRDIEFTFEVHPINAIERKSDEINEAGCARSIALGHTGTNAVIIPFGIPELAKLTNDSFRPVSNLQVGVNELCVLVGQVRFRGLQGKEESASTKKRLEISIEARRNERKYGVEEITLTSRPLQQRQALDLTSLYLCSAPICHSDEQLF